MKKILVLSFFVLLPFICLSQSIDWDRVIEADSLPNGIFEKIINCNNYYYFALNGLEMDSSRYYSGMAQSSITGEFVNINLILKDKPLQYNDLFINDNDEFVLIAEYYTVWDYSFAALGYLNVIKLNSDCDIIYDYTDSTEQKTFAQGGKQIRYNDNFYGIYYTTVESINKLYVKKFDDSGILLNEATVDFLPDSISLIGRNLIPVFFFENKEGNMLFGGSTTSKPYIIEYDENFNYIKHKYLPVDGISKLKLQVLIQAEDSTYYLACRVSDAGIGADSAYIILHLDKDFNVLARRFFSYTVIFDLLPLNNGKLLLSARKKYTENNTTSACLSIIDKNLQFDIEKEFEFYLDGAQKVISDVIEDNGKLIICGSYNFSPFAMSVSGMIEPNAVESGQNNDFKVSPNPFDLSFKIDGLKPGSIVEFFDVLGNKIAQSSASDTITGSISIDTANIPAGVYFVKVSGEGEIKSRLIIKY
jgi:hypothetical protein